MKKELWQSDQPVLKDDLDRAQTSKEEAIKERLNDTFSAGIVADSQFLAETTPFAVTVTDATLQLDIGTGVAYDANGERIVIDSLATYSLSNLTLATDDGIGGTTITPQSTGNQDIPLTDGVTNYVFITYFETTDPTIFTLQQTTNKRLFTKGDDGYRIDVVTDAAVPSNPTPFKPFTSSLFLTAIDYFSVPGTSTISTASQVVFGLDSGRVSATVPVAGSTLDDLGGTYDSGESKTYEEHVQAVGSGTPSATNPHGLTVADIGGLAGKTSEEHERLFHESGIAGDQTTTASSLYADQVDVSGPNSPGTGPTYGFDYIKVEPLTGDEVVQVGGITVDATALGQSHSVFFAEDTGVGVPLPDGTYTIYLEGTTNEIKVAHHPDASGGGVYRVFKSVSVTISTFTTLAISTVTGVDTNFLLWEIVWAGSQPPAPNPGSPDHITSITDRRIFGTIGSEALRRDSLTDTVSITHNFTTTKDITAANLTATNDANITNDLVIGGNVIISGILVAALLNLADRPSIVDTGTGSSFTVTFNGVGYVTDPTVAGAGGVASSSPAWWNASTDQWWGVYLIFNSDGSTVNTLLIEETDGSPTLPSGYTLKKRLGWVRSDSATTYKAFLQSGDWWHYNPGDIAIALAGGANDLSAYLPPTSVILDASVKQDSISTTGTGGGETALGPSTVTPEWWFTGARSNQTQIMADAGAGILRTDSSRSLTRVDTGNGGNVSLRIKGWYDPV